MREGIESKRRRSQRRHTRTSRSRSNLKTPELYKWDGKTLTHPSANYQNAPSLLFFSLHPPKPTKSWKTRHAFPSKPFLNSSHYYHFLIIINFPSNPSSFNGQLLIFIIPSPHILQTLITQFISFYTFKNLNVRPNQP